MRGRPEEKNRVQSPGPAEYSPTDTFSKERVRTYEMGKSKRTDIVSKEHMTSPGPGNYDSPHKKIGSDSVRYTIRGKQEEKIRSESPGPCAYAPSHSYNKDKVITHTISQSKRSEIVSKDEQTKPGPGVYSSDYKAIGKDV